RRIEEYGFVGGTDYTQHKFVQSTKRTGTAALEYYVTFTMAKELAMVERTPKGREIRLRLIRCEELLIELLRHGQAAKAFLLPGYEPWEKEVPDKLWNEICRVYGLPMPQGSQHSPACRGISFRTQTVPLGVPFGCPLSPPWASRETNSLADRPARRWRRGLRHRDAARQEVTRPCAAAARLAPRRWSRAAPS